MFRVIFYLLLTVIVISIVRSVIGVVLKGFAQMLNTSGGAPGGQPAGNRVPLTGELKKDPVCGTYVSAAGSVKETLGGQTFHFCSKECRDKYVASLAR